jgi:hypothetical protein
VTTVRKPVLESLSVDPVSADVLKLARELRGRSATSRQLYLGRINTLMRGKARGLASNRIAAAKMLVALLPESLPAIEKWLATSQDRLCYELHFSLFCFLGDAQSLPVKPSVRDAVKAAVVNYLSTVRSDAARAAWMAGDLLGDHWQGREALLDLIGVALNGPCAAGRKGALHGLGHRLDRASDADVVVDTLRRVVVQDRSAGVKRYARSLLSRHDRRGRVVVA